MTFFVTTSDFVIDKGVRGSSSMIYDETKIFIIKTIFYDDFVFVIKIFVVEVDISSSVWGGTYLCSSSWLQKKIMNTFAQRSVTSRMSPMELFTMWLRIPIVSRLIASATNRKVSS